MSAYESREHIPEQTSDALLGPAKRHQIEWYSLPKLPDLGPHQGRSATWLSIYGSLVRERAPSEHMAEGDERRLRVVG